MFSKLHDNIHMKYMNNIMRNKQHKTPETTWENPENGKYYTVHTQKCFFGKPYAVNTKRNLIRVSRTHHNTAQKMKFSIKDFFNKCDQIHLRLRIWSHLLKKSLMENFIFYAV